MSNTEETHDFYKDAQVLLESVLQELLLRVNLLRRYQMLAGERDPVEHCKGRIKSEDSMKEKLARKGLPITLDAALNEVHDAVGIRIVCQFVDDVYRMVDILKRQEDFILVKEKDFIKNPKPNGYRSYHMMQEKFFAFQFICRTVPENYLPRYSCGPLRWTVGRHWNMN